MGANIVLAIITILSAGSFFLAMPTKTDTVNSLSSRTPIMFVGGFLFGWCLLAWFCYLTGWSLKP